MSAISSWFWGASQLDEAIDKATSELLPSGSEDIALNLEICDQIRSKSAPPKDAMRALKRRLNHKNPNVQLLALGLTDICVKNGGDPFLGEIASREFMDNLVSILKMPVLDHNVKNTILRLIQNWSIAFEGKQTLSYVGQVYKTLQTEGFKFPPKDLTAASSAMVDTQTAPEWIDSDVCLRCRTAFTFTNRKHHCRNCGLVFDQQCSSKSMPLPHFGITQDVRVCDGCYNKLTKRGERTKPDKGHRHSSSLHTSSKHRSGQRDFSDADLQRAIQLSLQEVGAAGGHNRPGYVPYQASEPPLINRSNRPSTASPEEEDDPELRAAIEASLREANAPKPSAPLAIDTSRSEQPLYASGPAYGYSQSYPPGIVPPQPAVPKIPTYDLEPLETDAILTFSQTVEHVQSQGGRDMSRYPAVSELYDKANGLRPKLAMSLDDAGRKEQMLSDMHDKLSQAVKLYDQLLSEQVAHPRWRSPQVQANADSYQPQTQPQTNVYSQWAPQPTYQQPISEPQSQSYFPTAVPDRDSESTPKPQYYAEPSHYAGTQQAQQQLNPIPVSQPQYASASTSYQSPQPTAVASPPPQSQPQSPTTQYASSSLSRQNTVSYSYTHSPSIASSQLSRSNTVGARPEHQHQQYQYQPQPQPQPQPSQPQQYQPQPQPQLPSQPQPHPNHYVASPPPAQVPTAPSPLPQFPVAPTSTPQTFSMYGPSIPTGIAQTEERKEALLIDL